MYAVIQSGGKQYRVAVGDKLKVESLKVEEGDNIDLEQVLMIADGESLQVGTPVLNASVQATVVGHGRGEKIKILKFRRRQNSRTRGGHRQNFTELEITGISAKAAAKKKAAPKAEDKPAKSAVKEEAAPASDAPEKAAAAGSSDDLTQLKGVGPVIAKKLAAAGVTSLQQVAEFTAEDVARIDEELSFKGRIDREDWIGQAKELLEGQ